LNSRKIWRIQGIIAVLEAYLPQMMSQDELIIIVRKVIVDNSIADLQKGRGEIVKAVMAEHKAVVDGKMLQDVINGMVV
jgi:uncharacterized protein YqeY